MIVPHSKLLLWVCLVVLPFSLLGALEPAASAISLGAIGLLALLVLFDAFRAPANLAGLSIVSPEVTRMSKDREGKLELRIGNEKQQARDLRVALALPPELESKQEDVLVSVPAGSEWSRFHWVCLPRIRGNYRIGFARLETSSPFGFWAARKTVPGGGEIRVYPNLFSERKNLAALFLNRGAFGLHAQRQVGKGREFERLREYIPGDGYDEIHWKATAKRGRPVTKVFQIERTQEVYVVIDASRLSARPVPADGARTFLSAARSKAEGVQSLSANAESSESAADRNVRAPAAPTILERFVTAALVLGLAAEHQGDLFGLLTFTDKVDNFVRARNGKAHYGLCRDALYTLQPQVVTPDYDEVSTFIRLRLRRRALLIFLTSLDDPLLAESFVSNMDLICRQHLLLVNMLQPPGVAPVFTNPNLASVDDLYQHLGGHLLWHKLKELEKVLGRRGVHFSLLKNERLSADLVSQYLNVKRRQLI